MARPAPTHAEIATQLLSEARAIEDPTSSAAAALREESSAHALIAIAKELSGIRDEIANIDGALRDVSGHAAGVHLDHISDHLEKIARK